MCIPGDHGAPFLVSQLRRSYPQSDYLPSLQTASVSVCRRVPYSQHVPLEPKPIDIRAFHLANYLPACHTICTYTSSGRATTLAVAAPIRPKYVRLLFTIFLFLCWRLSPVTSNSDLPTMPNSATMNEVDEQPVKLLYNRIWTPGLLSGTKNVVANSDKDTIKKVNSVFPKRHVTRISVRHKREFVRQAPTGQGTSGTGAGTSTTSTATQLLNPSLIQFICSRLPDPCARAAYLREYVRHELCLNIPFLYMLPNTALFHINRTSRDSTNLYAPQWGTCRESGAHLLTYLNSDSLFEVFLSSPAICVDSLTKANQKIREKLEPMFHEFDLLLDKSFCKKQSDPDLNVTGEFKCEECRDAYRSWLCTTAIQPAFPLQIWPMDDRYNPNPESLHPNASFPAPGESNYREATNRTSSATGPHTKVDLGRTVWDKNLSSAAHRDPWIGPSRGPRLQRFNRYTSTRQYKLVHVEPCVSWCTRVETLCPYFNPADATSNGGEPAFLCDEGHYHHNSRYQVIYRPNQQCETECCYSQMDMQSLSHGTSSNSLFTRSDNMLSHPDSVISSTVHTDVSHLNSRDSHVSDTTSPVVQCESLQVRCIHHGYSNTKSTNSSKQPVASSMAQKNQLALSNSTMKQMINESSSSGTTSPPSLYSAASCSVYLSSWIMWMCLISLLHAQCRDLICLVTILFQWLLRRFRYFCPTVCFTSSVYLTTENRLDIFPCRTIVLNTSQSKDGTEIQSPLVHTPT